EVIAELNLVSRNGQWRNMLNISGFIRKAVIPPLRLKEHWKNVRKHASANLSKPVEHDFSGQTLDTVNLVYENVGVYNIVQFGRMLYGFPQSEGRFEPAKAYRGDY